MQLRPWGTELEEVSAENYDFLESDILSRIIVMGGQHTDLKKAKPWFRKMVDDYKRSEILKESQDNVHFNSMVCLDQISRLLRIFKDLSGMKVLELGAGIGNFSRIFRQFVDTKSYTILDLPVMSKFSKKFLGGHSLETEFVDSDKYHELADRKFDLFVSNICLSETPMDFRNEIINSIWGNCNRLFVIDGDANDPTFDIWLRGSIKKHFNDITALQYNQIWKEHYIYVAKRKRL